MDRGATLDTKVKAMEKFINDHEIEYLLLQPPDLKAHHFDSTGTLLYVEMEPWWERTVKMILTKMGVKWKLTRSAGR
jgi:hypothetical protein